MIVLFSFIFTMRTAMTYFHLLYDNTLIPSLCVNPGTLCEPIIKEAGRSVSHWFNEKDGDLKTFVCPVRCITMPYTPDGRFIHCPPEDPNDWSTNFECAWWKDTQYMIGKVSSSRCIYCITKVLLWQPFSVQMVL